jgi:CRP/FNR family transcriptional regulator
VRQIGTAMSNQRKDIHNSDIPVLCRSCEVRHKGVCGALTEEQLISLSKFTSRKTAKPGTQLIRESEPVSTYANVVSGVVKLSKLLEDGRQQIVGLQYAPDFLGRPFRKESLVAAEAATKVELCAFPKSVLERLMAESPELEHRLLEQSLKELDEAREWMVTVGRKSTQEKIANFLCLIASQVDPEADLEEVQEITFELPLIRSDIADFLGLTIETVSRHLTKLRSAGVISIENNRCITVPNMERLNAVAGN